MQLPRRLAPISGLVSRFRGGVPALWIVTPSSPRELLQGTRASGEQGTSSSSWTPDPLVVGGTISSSRGIDAGWDDPSITPVSAVFSTDTSGDIPNPSHTIVQTAGWPGNPSLTEYDSRGGERVEQALVSGDLHSGPTPARIPRYLPHRIHGTISPSTGGTGAGEGFPYNGDKDFVPHTWAARQALGTKGAQKLADDNAVIPAVYAGNPRG